MTFPFSLSAPVVHAGPLPAETDVAIIGGGVIGVMTAWFLADAGLRVTILEKRRIAAEQSSRNWGWIRQQGRDAAELPIMIESNRLWQQIARRSTPTSGSRGRGSSIWLTRNGCGVARAWRELARSHGLDTRL